jgi:hypothetical protein
MSRGAGVRFTPERARELAIAREAAKRARRLAAERGELAESASQPSRTAGVFSAPRIADPLPRIVEPLDLGDLTLGADGVLRPAERLGASERCVMARPAAKTLTRAPEPSLPPVPALVMAHADKPAKSPSTAAPEPVKLDPAQEARGRVILERLKQHRANPALARFMLPTVIEVPELGDETKCAQCGMTIRTVDQRQQHVVMRWDQDRIRCVRWALGIPEPPR